MSGPWTIPLALMTSNETILKTYLSDTYIGDLWVLCGSPTGPRNVIITVDGADIGDVIITNNWTGGSTFSFTCVNGGRIIGLGGDGGQGGPDTSGPGFPGGPGGSAISSEGFQVSVDLDDGFLMGGGGGGGGGGSLGATSQPGYGGGGGAGFSPTAGGASGTFTGLPVGYAGDAGGNLGPGKGGQAPGFGGIGFNDGTQDGGYGGNWGAGGVTGHSWLPIYDIYYENGEGGGRAGKAFSPTSGASLALSGVKSEATLRSEERLRGEITELGAIFNTTRTLVTSTSAKPVTVGFRFQQDGQLIITNSADTDFDLGVLWYGAQGGTPGNDYEVRVISRVGSFDTYGNLGIYPNERLDWDIEPGTPGDWFALTVNRTWEITPAVASTVETLGSAFEIRRADAIAGDIIDSGWIGRMDDDS